MDRVRKWAFGDYTIADGHGSEKQRVRVNAAIGIVEWTRGESVRQLMERADKEMYGDKMRPRAASSGGGSSELAAAGSG